MPAMQKLKLKLCYLNIAGMARSYGDIVLKVTQERCRISPHAGACEL